MSKYVAIQIDHIRLGNLRFREAFKIVHAATTEALAIAKVEAMGPYSTGYLALTLERKVALHGDTVIGEVGSDAYYARVAHDGARPHIIRPRRPGGKLRFYWRKVGHTVTFDYVNHPGMEGKRYLSRAVEIAGRRHRFLVFIYGH